MAQLILYAAYILVWLACPVLGVALTLPMIMVGIILDDLEMGRLNRSASPTRS